MRVDVARSDDALKLLRVAERLLDELLARQQQQTSGNGQMEATSEVSLAFIVCHGAEKVGRTEAFSISILADGV